MILNPSVLYAATGVHGQNSTTMALLAQECHKLKTGLRREETVSNQESQEIERTFRVRQIPKNIAKYPSENIAQGYLAIAPNGAEVRLRKVGPRYFETFKGSGTLQRRELEIELSPDQFHALWLGTEGQRIEKMRYHIEDKGQKIELNIFQGDLAGLVLAEVEFSSREESEGFDPPDWFGDEVTENVAYKNQTLAQEGLPKRSA